MAGKWSSGNSTAYNRFMQSCHGHPPPLVEDNTTLRVASWKQRIQFYPLANVAVQKSSIYM